jgi:hypothetical protein
MIGIVAFNWIVGALRQNYYRHFGSELYDFLVGSGF